MAPARSVRSDIARYSAAPREIIGRWPVVLATLRHTFIRNRAVATRVRAATPKVATTLAISAASPNVLAPRHRLPSLSLETVAQNRSRRQEAHRTPDSGPRHPASGAVVGIP